jgi:hypothetical protein
MFLRKSGLTVRNARFIKIIRLACIRLENAELQPRVNVTTNERRRGTVDRSTRFSVSFLKPPRSKRSGSNAKFVAI